MAFWITTAATVNYLVESVLWKTLERLRALYYGRPKSLWMIWNYLWDIGPRQTIRKVLSRNQERYWNEKYVACGVGYVRERPDGSLLRDGALVVFLAPWMHARARRCAGLQRTKDLSESLQGSIFRQVEYGRTLEFAGRTQERASRFGG